MHHSTNPTILSGTLLRRFSAVVAIVIAVSTAARAQIDNSPYSILGVGDIESSYFNRTSGMGNTGIAYRSNRSLILNNPASLSGLDNQWFNGELGVRGQYKSYSGTPVSQADRTSSEVTFKRFSIGMKTFKHMGTSIGLMPLSTQNYQFTSQQTVLGTTGESINSSSEGFGGLNKVYFGNSYEFFHHLSLGANISYVFGSTNQKTILQNPAIPSTYISTNNSTSYENFYLDFGAQFTHKFGKNWNFTLGVTYAPRGDLNTESKIQILNIDSVALKDQVLKDDIFTLPASYGVGIALTKNRKYTFLADYKYQNWNALHYSTRNATFVDSRRLSAGFEISHLRNVYNTTIETNFLQAGVYYEDSYLNVNGKQISDMGVTFGFGLNGRRSPVSYNVVLQYGIRGTTEQQLVEEHYFNLTFILSFREFWLTKGRRYD